MSWSEKITNVGDAVPLFGVLTWPHNIDNAETCLIVLNSGMMHHVGTCNLSVKTTRSAAEIGIPGYRFDFSGIGDSANRTFIGRIDEREVGEVREVMDELSALHGIKQFLLCGLCSGAFAAMATAVADPRVIGIAQIDPHCFRTKKWSFYHYFRKYTDKRAWRRLVRRLQGKPVWFDGLADEYLEDVDLDWGHTPQLEELSSEYQLLVSRGVRNLVIMTEGQKSCYSYRGQFREVFEAVSFGELLEEHFFPVTRHIITEPEDQVLVEALIISWASRILDGLSAEGARR